MRRALFLLITVLLTDAAPAFAQDAPQPPPAAPQAPATPSPPAATGEQRLRIGDFEGRAEVIATVGADQLHFEGNARIPLGADSRIFADIIDVYVDTQRLVASGNVVLQNAEGQIAADRVELNVGDGTGVFYRARGAMSLGQQVDRAQFGGQDPDVYFEGEKIERLGPRRYRITRGGFTTCVQPEPRWEVVSRSLIINLDDYAIATHTVLRVKGVPVLYLPVVYYPIQDDERATGFLLPTYGASRLRGQTLSNAFFWAIGRSHDATIAHDWFTKAGQGIGAEYRYIAGTQSSGDVRMRRFNQKEASYTTDGTTRTIAASTSFELTGTAVQALTPSLRARARLDYASDIISQQLYQQNVYRASNPIRAIEGSVSGAWGALSASGTYQRTEVFSSETRSVIYGSTPRITAAVAPKRLFGAPIYGSLNGEYAYLPYRDVLNGTVTLDKTLSRADFSPSLRVPLSGLTYLTVNTNATLRGTYYTRSAEPNGVIVAEPLMRTYLSTRSEVVGPVFNKIWDTPDSTATERRKHVIEPAFSLDYVSPIENFTRVPVLSDYSDVVVGSTTRVTYGITNRLFSRARAVGATRGAAREVLTIGVQQTYYTNAQSGQYDPNYQSSFSFQRPIDLSPISVTTRFSPSAILDTNSRLEYDVTGNGLQLLSAGGGTQGPLGSVTFNYSWRHLNKSQPADNYLSTSSSVRLRNGRVTSTYGLSWDIGRSYVVSQTLLASYMAQCCGFQVEYQQFNYPVSVGIPLPSDRRFNFGFTLAGLGTFSNFFGAFGGSQ
jgi:LPS-assembly protein